ncbi:MAG: DUF3995 domain-containing protein [Caldimonas sp.]
MIAFLVAAAFAAIALIHVYWAFGGSLGGEAAVPRAPAIADADPQTPRPPAFVPTRSATLMVAAALTVVAGMVALQAGWFGPSLPSGSVRAAIGVVAAVMFLRAVGDFRLVGFFKRRIDSRFAQLDSWFYSPLCVVLGAGLSAVALG